MTITIENLRFDTIIGMLDAERKEKQEIRIDMEIEYSYRKKFYLDYVYIVREVKKLIRKNEYGLLEDALIDIKDLLPRLHPEIVRLYCKITKPHILPDCEVALGLDWIY
jgi:dihydroneopterin aldolase